MSTVRFLVIMPLLQLSLIYFSFGGESERLFAFLALSIVMGFLTFHFIRQLKKHDRPEWIFFLLSSSLVAAFLTLPVGLWSYLSSAIYTGRHDSVAIALPFLLFLPLCMSFFELYFIFRRTEKAL